MKTMQDVKPKLLSAAQPPRTAGQLFQIRTQREPVAEQKADSLNQIKMANHAAAEPETARGFQTPQAKKQCAGLW